MSHGLSPISVLSQPGHSNSLTLSQRVAQSTFRDVRFETTRETNVHPCCVTMSSLLRLVISSQSASHSSHGKGVAVTNRGRERSGVGTNPTRPARESNRLRAVWARERDMSAISWDRPTRLTSERSVQSTHQAEGEAATNRGRERSAGH